MDATSANNVLNATTNTIVDLLWGEVQAGEWATAVVRMDNAMHAARAVIQHADMIPGIVIAVEQLLHPEAAVWPNWMGMIHWTHKSVARHPWAQQGTIVQMEYEFGEPSTNNNEVSQPPEERMGVEEEVQGAQILHTKMEEEDEEDVAYRGRQKEHVKGKKRADATEGESSLGKRKADEALEDERERGQPWMRGSSSNMTTTQPMLIHQPGGRMTTAKKAAKPKRMTKAQQAAERRRLKEHMDDIESEDEDPIGDAIAGSTSSAGRMMTTPTPAPPSTPPHTPIPVPTPAQRRQGRRGRRRGAQEPLAEPQPANACSTCVDLGILCEPNLGYSCFTCWSRKKNPDQRTLIRNEEHPPYLEHHPRFQPQDHNPPANTQDHPNVASSSTGIILRIPPSRATPATTIRMESAPQTSAVTAPVNMGLIPGTTYSIGGNPLVSHEEHCAALQRLETVEGENRKLRGLITRALDHIEVLEQGMASLGGADMGFPFEQEGSTAALDQDLRPAEPSHSPSPSLPSNTIAIPSAVNLDMRWHIGPAIIQSTTPMPPSASPWTSSDARRSRSMPATATIYSSPQTSSADDPPIPAPLTEDPAIPAPLMDDPPIPPPVSPAMSIPPVEVLAETESASDNGGSGDNNGSGENNGSGGSD
ncbi:hypothetical protein PAXINDRAFT_16908 [Paxillus involutus ATCC 200175]|uniref:Uncharacterized protein n=1 Tax=Paxillus involutus ATCC 200175 TaxID=664439 RepID=A0A0C9TQP0_PAXIN|nr:hypothetical protein PAXINDRAFT_16908 [Paxillus involutus ATCC 200175]